MDSKKRNQWWDLAPGMKSAIWAKSTAGIPSNSLPANCSLEDLMNKNSIPKAIKGPPKILTVSWQVG